MGEGGPDQISSDQLETLPLNIDQFQQHELYKIWLVQNGYPRQATESEWNEYRNHPDYRRAVGIDLSIYMSFCLAWILISAGLTYAPVVITTSLFAFAFTYFLDYVLPRETPVAVVGILSLMAYLRSAADLKLKVQPPPISKVNLDTFPVVVEAAKKYAEPATKKIAVRINELENELRAEQIDREKLESLHAQLVSESQRSNDEWKNILEPKISKIKELLIHTQDQIQELEHLIGNLQSKRANLEQQLQQLVHRYYLITQVEKAEKETAQPETISASSLNDFLVLLKESQSALHEANQVSTAHEQAKNEIAELLES